RIWNAAAAADVELPVYGGLADTLSVCLSKGLGAPVGSLVVSSRERIARARVLRKRLGGGRRQAGILAAAGRYALAHHRARLPADHARAARLAAGLGLPAPQTNIVVADVPGPAGGAAPLAAAAREGGVLIGVVSPRRVRMVTHLDVSDADIDRALALLAPLLARAAAE
ncbi:MAG: beta-eliminating lyase-related protein, partial [Mycobacteriales bacterium]